MIHESFPPPQPSEEGWPDKTARIAVLDARMGARRVSAMDGANQRPGEGTERMREPTRFI